MTPEELKTLRTQAGLTQAALASRIDPDMSARRISDMENGRAKITQTVELAAREAADPNTGTDGAQLKGTTVQAESPAYREGYVARNQGKGVEACPYHRSRPDDAEPRRDWLNGYYVRDGELQRGAA